MRLELSKPAPSEAYIILTQGYEPVTAPGESVLAGRDRAGVCPDEHK